LDQDKIYILENKINELEKRNEFLENRMDSLENLWRENNTIIAKRKPEDNKNRIIVHSVLYGIIARIARMDQIKNKMNNVF